MRLIRYRPAAPLDAYVECFWWSQRDTPQSFCEYMLPSGSVQLIFPLHEAPIVYLPNSSSKGSFAWSRGVVHGPQWSYFVSGPKPCGAIAGVSLRPGTAGGVLGIPVSDLSDQHVTIDSLWGARGRALREQLRATGDPSTVFRILERDLTARVRRPLLIHPAIAHALAVDSTAWSHMRVTDIQRETGYSPKHFIALFRSAVGLTPKHYYRVKRFTAVLKCLAASDRANLAAIAASAGYSDQSHLTREFRDFAGITPTQYRPGGPDNVFHHRAPDSFRMPPQRQVKKVQDVPKTDAENRHRIQK